MRDPERMNKRLTLLWELVWFHEARASEAEAFRETPQARHHRDRASKLRYVIETI
jgi:hypothetical protein